MNTRILFICSGFFAFLLYFLILAFLIFGFDFSNPLKYVFKTDTQIEQSIAIDAILDTSSESQNTEDGGNPLEGTGIKDIFSSIDSKVSPDQAVSDNRDQVAKNLALKKQRQKILERLESDMKDINSKLETIKNKTIDIQSQNPKPDTSDGLYDQWFGEVYKILYSKWKLSFYKNASVSVLLTITDTGDFSYRILRYSPYDDYNQSVESLLKSLKNQKFPPYPKGKFVNIEVNFRTEEK
ncbi:TonB C-terminal domain-containing protein [Helicobacter sp. 11S02596-1]|uniref:energy transducer TonB n=1 Tax=Helicobacter sp. 11S02596-1 TaxID=1476194 RepID=UPI000BA707BB|nr:TonB C-terminal domain-containing protein [Helicobacter sp. 11S02596-1]PAF44211.1 hypothetical protein BJI48_03240 [Helicobacter sp. 11S02596-1]